MLKNQAKNMYKYIIINAIFHVIECEIVGEDEQDIAVVDKKDLSTGRRSSHSNCYITLNKEKEVAIPAKNVYLMERNDKLGKQLLKEYYQHKLLDIKAFAITKENEFKNVINNLS